MGKKKDDEEESDLIGQSDTEKKEAELIERELRVEEAEAKIGGKGEKTEKKYAPRCPKCDSTQVHIRIRDGAIVCHRCGEVTVMERSGY